MGKVRCRNAVSKALEDYKKQDGNRPMACPGEVTAGLPSGRNKLPPRSDGWSLFNPPMVAILKSSSVRFPKPMRWFGPVWLRRRSNEGVLFLVRNPLPAAQSGIWKFSREDKFTSPNDYVQLLVTAKLDSGDHAGGRDATFTVSPDSGEISTRGILRHRGTAGWNCSRRRNANND